MTTQPVVDELEEAWGRLHEAMPARWTVGRPSYDPGKRAWSISAVGPHPGRGKMPRSLSGNGEDELRAIHQLDARLRGEEAAGLRNLEALRARLALAYIAGGEEESRRNLGRGLTADGCDRILGRIPRAAR